ncbi:MAG: hypothetical protein QXM55_04885 [Ignisphaera sp.]
MVTLKILTLIVATLAILMVIAVAIYYLTPSIAPQTTYTTVTTTINQTQTTTVSPSSPLPPTQPIITDIISEGFVFVDEDLYWRIKILGEADLRNKIEINGVYSHWFGRLNVTLPNGDTQDRIHIVGNYVDIVSQFTYLSKEMTLDIYIPTKWWEKICLEGIYSVVVWLKGPYNNYTILFSKNFTHIFSFNAIFKPTKWSTWNETIEIEVNNTGDIPLIISGGGFVLSGTDTVIGWWNQPSEIIVMPGEFKVIRGSIDILSSFREEFKGKTKTIDIYIDVIGAPMRYTITTSIEFPSK